MNLVFNLEFRLYSCPKCQCGFVTPHLALTHIRKICKVEGAIPVSFPYRTRKKKTLTVDVELLAKSSGTGFILPDGATKRGKGSNCQFYQWYVWRGTPQLDNRKRKIGSRATVRQPKPPKSRFFQIWHEIWSKNRRIHLFP